jgi:hypothetical protein
VGVFWTYDPRYAREYMGAWKSTAEEEDLKILVGVVNPEDVDWPITLALNMWGDVEREIRLKPGAPVKIIAIYDGDGELVSAREREARANPRRTRRTSPRRRNPSTVDMSDNLPSMAWLRENAAVDIEEGNAFFDAKERVQEWAEEKGEDPPEDEELREAVWDYLGDVVYADFALEVQKFTTPIRIFRAVALAAVGGVDTLRTHELGVYWTWDEYAAEPYWGGIKHPARETTTFVIEALVTPADVNWESTLIANMTRPEEKEVTLREGAPVRVVAVYDLSAKERVRGAFDARANPRRTRRH